MKLKCLWVMVFVLSGLQLQVAQAAPPQEEKQLAASLEVLIPGVEVMIEGTDQWLPVTGRAVVATGDTIRTDSEGEAIVTWFADGTMMDLSPDTEVLINQFSGTNANDEEGTFTIETTVNFGRVFHGVNRIFKDESNYKVNTPSMTATVRGTVFAVNITEADETLLLVTDGTVVANQGESEQAVEGGYWLLATPDTPLPEPVSIESVKDDPTVKAFIAAFETFEVGRLDTDGDYVFDFTDACPEEAGLPAYSGCPRP